MGLPSTTAVVLVGCGLERGLDEAAVAAEACLVGLIAAATLPLAYTRAAAAGWRWPAATAAAVASYVAVAAGLWWLPKPGAGGCVAMAAAGLVVTCQLARKTRPVEPTVSVRRRPISLAGQLACRTAIPAGYFLMIRVLRSLAGAGFAGRFITFPGGSLAVLVTTHLESGPGHACRMASAMPTGGLGMLAFLTVFRFGCTGLGLGWGTASGFAAALATLAAIGAISGHSGLAAMPGLPRAILGRTTRIDRAHQGEGDARRSRRKRPSETGKLVRPVRVLYRRQTRFSPWVEALVD